MLVILVNWIVAVTGGCGIHRSAAGGEIERPQFAVCLRAGSWTNRREFRLTRTRSGENDLCALGRCAFDAEDAILLGRISSRGAPVTDG